MVLFLFFLSLLTVISCDNTHQSPCDSSFKLTPCTDCKLVYHIHNHSFTCPKDHRIIYTPDVDTGKDSYRIELFSLSCIVATNKWEAVDRFETLDPTKSIYSKRNIFATGNLHCADENFKLSCSLTRLDFHENLDDRLAVVPIYRPEQPPMYSCSDNNHKLFYTPKISLHPREGLYLTESPVCKNSILTAKFTTNEYPLNISYLGSISCKKFICSDSNDAPYTWPLIIGMNFNCDSLPGCLPPKWSNEISPCGDGGHQLAIHRHNKWIWLKDHYFRCGANEEIIYTESNGHERNLDIQSDKIMCNLPPPCVPLMSDPQSTYGCFNRSSCNPIDPKLIPFSHLTSFDGRCYQKEHTLKIVTEPTSMGIGAEIDFVSCQYGNWIVTLAKNSKVNNVFSIEDLNVDKHTNFVCEGRVDYSKCEPPISKCEEEERSSVGKMCKPVTVNEKGDGLICDPEMDLLLRTKFTNGADEIKSVDSEVICDGRSGKWISTKKPFIEQRNGIDKNGIGWESFFVCAKKSCAEFSSVCETEDNGKDKEKEKDKEKKPGINCKKVEIPKYWLNAACPYPYQLFYSENGNRAPNRIEKLHCDDSSVSNGKLPWKFFEIGGTTAIEATKEDNFFCQEEQPLKSRVRVRQMEETSPECNPARLESICQTEVEYCTPVSLRIDEKGDEIVTTWYCPGPEIRNLFYYESGNEEKIELASLNCSSKKIFWQAYRKVPLKSDKYFTPPPHSNIVCLSTLSNITEEKEKEKSNHPLKKGKRKRMKKGWQWTLDVYEALALLPSLLIFALSAALFVWARRKYYKGKRSDHSVEDH